MSKTFLLYASAGLVFFLGLFTALERPEWVPGVAAPEEDPVRVFLVGSRRGVGHLRAVVDPAHVTVDGESAFALGDGRIVAAEVEDANGPLAEAGWSDRPIEIVALPRVVSPEATPRAKAPPGADAAGGADLAALLQKSELNAHEALAALHALESVATQSAGVSGRR